MIVWKLDALMRARGVKGRELARRLDIGENYLSRIRHEVPDRLSLELLDGLCRELACGIEDLLEHRGANRVRKAAARKVAAPRAVAVPVLSPAEPAEASAFVDDVLTPLMAELAPSAEAPPGPAPASAEPVARTVAASDHQEESTAPQSGSAVLKTSALQARLDRLKRRRPS